MKVYRDQGVDESFMEQAGFMNYDGKSSHFHFSKKVMRNIQNKMIRQVDHIFLGGGLM